MCYIKMTILTRFQVLGWHAHWRKFKTKLARPRYRAYTTYNQNSYKQIKGIERMQYRESLMCFFIYYIVFTFLFDWWQRINCNINLSKKMLNPVYFFWISHLISLITWRILLSRKKNQKYLIIMRLVNHVDIKVVGAVFSLA